MVIRFAVDKSYDKMIMATYDRSILDQRILEDDIITIYGTSANTYTYESTMGQAITVPMVLIDKIDM